MSYNPDNDFIDCWFIVYKGDGLNEIVAWSPEKILAKSYLELHNSKKMILKKYSDTRNHLREITNEHINEEIRIGFLKTIIDNKLSILRVPVTELDMSQVREWNGTFCEGIIDYTLIYKFISKFKKKYQQALKTILLDKIIEAVIFPKPNLPAAQIDIDEVRLLHRLSPLF